MSQGAIGWGEVRDAVETVRSKNKIKKGGREVLALGGGRLRRGFWERRIGGAGDAGEEDGGESGLTKVSLEIILCKHAKDTR